MSDLQTELAHFTGTTRWYRLDRRMLFTDGVKHLADRANCYWLLQLIGSFQHLQEVKRETWQSWKLTVTPDKEALIVMTNGRTPKTIVERRVEYTDFPLREMTLWVEEGDGEQMVILLPSEH
ncbi:hypothetical protein BKE38_08640 [Pseudoroseomonas deserti]|uniref:DUF6876 domain-containing protein n=1 Tax=Teichococcus deserti TaxID=1817963 RepID=A0A1V2H3X3_9PROT|nr:DUF6876 family protein [Pseudoroseomonas deserti]ONG55724.1 hypothetical protein BKE38_08640 [Pseudoroseomonas deserti]